MNKQSIIKKILHLKKIRNAVILAHNYQTEEVQDIADFVGDSLGLSQKAAAAEAAVILFCGVHFMAETAAMLSPDKIVLLPDPRAGCPMADMITAAALRHEKEKYPGVQVVCYVNSTAEVKAESDLCCTSSNAIKVVQSLESHRPILFVPDQYLGSYSASKTNRDLILWPGYCPVHMHISVDDIKNAKSRHHHAAVLVHPECRPEVIALADHALSTDGILRHARESGVKEFIVGTETGILHRLKKENPEKVFIPASQAAVCIDMKLVTLEKILWSLETMEHRVIVPEAIRKRAVNAVARMIEII